MLDPGNLNHISKDSIWYDRISVGYDIHGRKNTQTLCCPTIYKPSFINKYTLDTKLGGASSTSIVDKYSLGILIKNGNKTITDTLHIVTKADVHFEIASIRRNQDTTNLVKSVIVNPDRRILPIRIILK